MKEKEKILNQKYMNRQEKLNLSSNSKLLAITGFGTEGHDGTCVT